MKKETVPFFSIIVPVMDATVHLLSFTLDSIIAQTGCSHEILLVDGCSEKQGRPFLCSYFDHLTIIPAENKRLPQLLNCGINRAKGEFVHFLLPGEYYMTPQSTALVAKLARSESHPDLLYTGFIIRHSLWQPLVVLQRICKRDLKAGLFSSTLQPYWFKREALQKVGGFNERYQLQASFDLICRFFENRSLKKLFFRRVLTDHDYRKQAPTKIARYFWETVQIIVTHFGISSALLRLIARCNAHLVRWSLSSLREVFWKKNRAY